MPSTAGLLFALLAACSVDIPEGTIRCEGPDDSRSCPEGWHCHADALCYSQAVGDATTPPVGPEGGVSPGAPDSASAPGVGAEAQPPPGPVEADSGLPLSPDAQACGDCTGLCGTILDACGSTVECGPCLPDAGCAESNCIPPCGGCWIDGNCEAPGAINPDNPCQSCDISQSSDAWSPRNGALCDDGLFCTTSDVCDGDTCAGETRNCDDGVSCNGTERCDEGQRRCAPGTPQCGDDAVCDPTSDRCQATCTGCLIDGTCYAADAPSPQNECLFCDPAADDRDWTLAFGAPCGDGASSCSGQDTCTLLGICLNNHRPRGTPCGNDATICSGQDTCDGLGNCVTNDFATNVLCAPGSQCVDPGYCNGNGACSGTKHRAAGSPCGSGPSPCSAQDTCNGNGVCLPNNLPQATPCGTPGECERQDLCDGAGSCVDAGFDAVGTPCGQGPTPCSHQDTCDGAGQCEPNHSPPTVPCGTPGTCEEQAYCDGDGMCGAPPPRPAGTPCGEDPAPCSDQDTCDGSGKCSPNHWGPGTQCGPHRECRETDVCIGGGICRPGMTLPQGTPCDDGDACTTDDVCSAAGTCEGTLACAEEGSFAP